MGSRRFRLTKTAKILILIIVLCVLGGGVFAAFKTGLVKNEPKKTNKETVVTDSMAANSTTNDTKDTEKKNESVSTTPTEANNTINLSIDEWVGYATIIQANGGLTTQPGSIYDKLGIKVNVNIINDPTQSSNALIKGELDAAGYTINRLAFLSNKFSAGNTRVVVPFITNYSNGGDGIIAKSSIKTIEDLVDAKIGVPQFGEAHAMIVWFVNQSNLSQEDKDNIINNLILFDTANDTANAFFAGQIDVAGTWQPYLSQTENMTDSHVLFSTANSTKLILDAIVFREDFATKNSELVSKFIDGTLQAIELYDKELDVLRNSMPMFNGMSDEDIIGMTLDADLATWKNNMNLFEEDAKIVYNNMCDVWTSIGESVDINLVNTLFDPSYMYALKDKYEESIVNNTVTESKVSVTEDNKQQIMETTALLTKSASVNFIINTAKFTDTAEASTTLNEFIEVAKLLDGTIIQIEGNTDPNPNTDPTDEANIMLSKQRAETVKQYFIMNGISADRIIVVGNGSSKPIVENDTEEHRAMNRRTDVSFKCIE